MANTTSAFLGEPPNTLDDFYIVRGMYYSAGITDFNASLGYTIVPKRPADYVHESKQPAIIVGMAIVVLVVSLVTGTRLYLRALNPKMRFGWDDWTILLAAGLAILYPIFQIVMVVRGGAGHHMWEVTYSQYNTYAFYGAICQIIFFVAVGLVKISITLFVRRLTDQTSRRWRIIADIFLSWVVGYVLIALFWSVFICTPPRARWDRWYYGQLDHLATCGNFTANILFLSITHVVQGMMLLSAPIIILRKVRMDRKKKARLFSLWAAGGLTVLGGLLRQVAPNFSADVTWGYTEILIWTSVDLCMGIVTASLPVMDAFLFGSGRVSTSVYWGSKKLQSVTLYRDETRSHGRNYNETSATDSAWKAGGRPRTESTEIMVTVDNAVELRDLQSNT